MRYFIDDHANVWVAEDHWQAVFGPVEKTDTVRIDDYTVNDISYKFDLDKGQYVEQSRTQREDPLYTLDEVKAQQKQILKAAHDAELYTSFQSKALDGVTLKTYSYSPEAAQRLQGWLTVVAANPAVASIDWYNKEDGKVAHTRDQFISVCMDGATRVNGIENKLIALNDSIDTIQTSDTVTLAQAIDQVKAITW